MREAIHEDYDGVVFCKEGRPDHPVRGPHGYAYIPLVDGAIPQRSKTFRQFVVREEALRKITQEWLDRKFIERPSAENCEWVSQAFAVPQHSDIFPWLGVVDMRGPTKV